MHELQPSEEEVRTLPRLKKVRDALDELLSLAEPPKSLALPKEVRVAIMRWIEGWRKDVMQLVVVERIGTPDRYTEFCQHVQNYTIWLQAGINEGQAMHSDVFIAVVSSLCPLH